MCETEIIDVALELINDMLSSQTATIPHAFDVSNLALRDKIHVVQSSHSLACTVCWMFKMWFTTKTTNKQSSQLERTGLFLTTFTMNWGLLNQFTFFQIMNISTNVQYTESFLELITCRTNFVLHEWGFPNDNYLWFRTTLILHDESWVV